MVPEALYNDLNLVPRGYRINPDWNRNFREDQDKVTKVIGQILDMTLGHYINKERTMLSEFYFTKYWGVRNYCFVYKIKEEYHQTEVLIGAIMESTDEVLRWYDLTTMVNFNIIVITPYRTIRKTYLDLLYEYVTMSANGRFFSAQDIILNHPRIQQMKEWVTRYREYDRVTQKTSLAGDRDPYSYMDRGREQGEFLKLRDDVDSWKREPMSKYNSGIPKEYMSMSTGIEQRVIEKLKVDKEWVSKLNKLLKKLKL
jgi:hypothetical protein